MSSPNTSHSHEPGTPVHRITEAQESHTVEKRSRVVKYTISMSIRMACFIAAFFVHGWLQWVLLGAAVVLPYIAVVVANGGADLTKREPPAEFFAGDDPRLLTAGPQPTTAKPQAASSATSTPTEERNDDEYLGEDGELITDPPLSSRSDSPTWLKTRIATRRKHRPPSMAVLLMNPILPTELQRPKELRESLGLIRRQQRRPWSLRATKMLAQGLSCQCQRRTRLEQPQDSHARTAQDLAGMLRACRLARKLPFRAIALQGAHAAS